MSYDWDFGRLAPYVSAYAQGTVVTLWLTALVVLGGTLLGVVLGLALSRHWLRVLFYPVIDLVRAVPPLVLILFFYYLLSRQVVGVTVSEFWVCVIAMSLNLGAFTADLVRAAVDNVQPESTDAARSLGFSEAQVVRHFVVPHVTREVIPGMLALYVGMLKLSSLASVVSVREVVYAAQAVIVDTTRSLESWMIVGGIYVSLVVPATYCVRRLEVRIGRGRSAVRI